jgi:hypothetical protein
MAHASIEVFSDGRIDTEQAPREGLIDDRDLRRILIVVPGKFASCQ